MQPNDPTVSVALINGLPAILMAVGTMLASCSALILGVLAHIRQKRQDALNTQVKTKTNQIIDVANALKDRELLVENNEHAVAKSKAALQVKPEIIRIPDLPEKFHD